MKIQIVKNNCKISNFIIYIFSYFYICIFSYYNDRFLMCGEEARKELISKDGNWPISTFLIPVQQFYASKRSVNPRPLYNYIHYLRLRCIHMRYYVPGFPTDHVFTSYATNTIHVYLNEMDAMTNAIKWNDAINSINYSPY